MQSTSDNANHALNPMPIIIRIFIYSLEMSTLKLNLADSLRDSVIEEESVPDETNAKERQSPGPLHITEKITGQPAKTAVAASLQLLQQQQATEADPLNRKSGQMIADDGDSTGAYSLSEHGSKGGTAKYDFKS